VAVSCEGGNEHLAYKHVFRFDEALGDENAKVVFHEFYVRHSVVLSRSQWPCGLRRGSAAARLIGLWVRIPLSSRSLCVGLVPRPEESYRVWCV
jgi:hypothetical protein